MKIPHLILIGFFTIAAVGAPAYADCKKDGKNYAEGTVIGGFICKNGKWVKV